MQQPSPPHAYDTWASARWQVCLLGGLELRAGAQRLTRLPSRAHVALLARLALAPQRAHAREELIELLWPGVALDAGRNRLRQVLSTLKSVLETPGDAGPVLLADRIALRVAPGALACDVLRFEQCLRSGAHAEAARLYRGELLPGYYDDWIADERLRLEALHDRLPPAEPMPAPAQTPTPLPPAMARDNLPHSLTPLFGLDAGLARLRERVLARRLVSVLGPGGCGKTRLITETARSLAATEGQLPDRQAPFDRVVFVALAGCHHAGQMDDALLAAVQAGTGSGAPLGRLVAALAGRRVLLVLDNCEQLDAGAGTLVAELLARLPLLHVLSSSRRPLGLEGEQEFLHGPLDLPATGLDAQAAAVQPAVALFIDRARAVRADFHASPRNVEALIDLVRELEGLPLAIELAAARLRSLGPAELLQRLRGDGSPHLALLARPAPRSGGIARHASMAQVVAWSWDQLEPAAQQLLARLSLLRAPCSAATAEELGADLDDTGTAFEALLTHSLLRVSGQVDDAPRFWPFESVREYAAARLADPATARRHLRAWALLWAEQLPPTPSLPTLRAEAPNLVAALASAAQDGAGDFTVALLSALRRTLEDVGLPLEGLDAAERSLAACSSAALRARGQSLLAPLHYAAGQAQAALDLAEAGAQGSAGTADEARAQHALARVRWRSRRRAAEVEPLLDRAEALEAQAPDADLRASLLALRAFVANSAHRDFARGAALHGRALTLWLHGGNQHAINSGRYNLAICAGLARDHARALALLAPVLASARELQDFRRITQSLNVQGEALTGLRRWAEAVASYRECLQVAWAVMAPHDLAYGFWNLPRALAHERQPERAVQLMAFAVRYWRDHMGTPDAGDDRDVLRLRRLARRQLDAPSIQLLWIEGEALTLAQAFALATSP